MERSEGSQLCRRQGRSCFALPAQVSGLGPSEGLRKVCTTSTEHCCCVRAATQSRDVSSCPCHSSQPTASQNKTGQQDRAQPQLDQPADELLPEPFLPQSQQHPLPPPSYVSQKQQPELPKGQQKPDSNSWALPPFLKSLFG